MRSTECKDKTKKDLFVYSWTQGVGHRWVTECTSEQTKFKNKLQWYAFIFYPEYFSNI